MYNIHFPNIKNMGDLLNKNMLEDIFGIKVIATPVIKSNISAIGSGLGGTLWASNIKSRIKQYAYYPFVPADHYVWGTGFLSHSDSDNPFYFKKMHFCSVRGELTKKRVESIVGQKLDIPTGDGGLLAERWVGAVRKKHSIGIIPHYKEGDHSLINEIANFYNNSIIIDLSQEPSLVIKNIASCETILSSSLHGLIIADSYHIPNMHMLLYPYGERIMGDGYKFEDYYSSYDLLDNPIDMKTEKWPTLDEIRNRYNIDLNIVEQKKECIYKAFPIL